MRKPKFFERPNGVRTLLKSAALFTAFIFLAADAVPAQPDSLGAGTSDIEKKYLAAIRQVETDFNLRNYLAAKTFAEPKETRAQRTAREEDPRRQYSFIRKGLKKYEASLNRNRVLAERRRLDIEAQWKNEATPVQIQKASPAFIEYLSSPFGASLDGVNVRLPEEDAAMEADSGYPGDPENIRNVIRFMKKNVTKGGMPLSYAASVEDWSTWVSSMEEVDAVMERLIVAHSVSIYDAAVWQVALALMDYEGNEELINNHTRRLQSGRSGELENIRGNEFPFRYGERRVKLSKKNAYFFRIIADEYYQTDPQTGLDALPGFPNDSRLHHEDWKPITGEQAWATMIGPLQLAYLKYKGQVEPDHPEVLLALSVLPSIEAMQSKIGAIYHAPHGTHGKDPHDISNENNFSVYAGLKMLHSIVKDSDPRTADRIFRILKKMEDYFRYYAFDRKNGYFYQGGFYARGKFIPTKIFAVDCQTWGTIVMGPQWIDDEFGEGASYRIWQNTKKRAGYYDAQGILRGVGFTDGHRVNSVEWTAGAILLARILGRTYEGWQPLWGEECKTDAYTMRQGIEKLKRTLPDGSVAYLYANKRSFIPFGWWANGIPSLISSGWIVLIDQHFNPFVLGGGPYFRKL